MDTTVVLKWVPLAIQPAKASKHRQQFKHFAPKNAFDGVQKALQQAEEEGRKIEKSMPSTVQEFN